MLILELQRRYHNIISCLNLYSSCIKKMINPDGRRLPRKSDIERKIEIIQFATNARQQFIRLLALVKWASTADKVVDKCQVISTFLDQQNMFFIDTADMLSKMARETLVNARLPNFSLPTAVDVLTTGKFNRLPRCIRDKIIPPDPISPSDKKRTLKRLNAVIRNRLITSKIPPEFSSFHVGEGRVKLRVEDEFEVTLMLMGDEPTLPWRLLNIEFLMQDFETGDGKPLVHNMQIQYIRQLVQSRLMSESEPLVDVYKCLHYFAMSLQLEVLHTQALRLIGERWGDMVKIDEYHPGQKLVLSYWRSSQGQGQVKGQGQGQSQALQPPCIVITANDQEISNLSLVHQPELEDDRNLFHRTMSIRLHPSCLSIERIVAVATKERAKMLLKKLMATLAEDEYFSDNAIFDEDAPCIQLKPFGGCTSVELMTISLDLRNGNYIIGLDDKVGGSSRKAELVKILRTDIKQFPAAFHNLRCLIYLERCAKAVSLLPVKPCRYLPIINTNNHQLGKLGKNKLFIQFNKDPNYCLVVVTKVNHRNPKKPLLDKFYLLRISPVEDPYYLRPSSTSSTDSDSKDKGKDSTKSPSTKTVLFYKAEDLIQLNAEAFQPSKKQTDADIFTESTNLKRKVTDEEDGPKKKSKTEKDTFMFAQCQNSSSTQPNVTRIVSSCNSRIPFVDLCKELFKTGIPHQGVQPEGDIDHCIRILELPDPEGCKPKLVKKLRKYIISCVLRLDSDMNGWRLEYRFRKGPFGARSSMGRQVTAVYRYKRMDSGKENKSKFKSVSSRILTDWKAMVMMYEQAVVLEEYLRDVAGGLSEIVSMEHFDYQSLTISYGSKRNFKVRIKLNSDTLRYELGFGETGTSTEPNPHVIVVKELEEELNNYRKIPYLLKVLHETVTPMNAIQHIPTSLSLGIVRFLSPSKNITIIPYSSTHVKIFYRNNYVLDVYLLEGKVMLRDGAYSKVDSSKPFGGIRPAEHLTNFIQLFTDKQQHATVDLDQSAGYGSLTSYLHGQHEVSPQSLSSSYGARDLSMRSPSFSSPPSQSSSGPGSVPSYGGQLSTMSPANMYSSASPASYIQSSPAPANPLGSPGGWPTSPQVAHGSPHVGRQGLMPAPSSEQSSQSVSKFPLPVVVSHSSFARMVTPVAVNLPWKKTGVYSSPLERFFGSIFHEKHLHRVILKDTTLHLEKYEGGLVFYGNAETGLQYMVRVNPHTLDSLCLKVTPKQGYENHWSHDELRILEQFFEIAFAPCKPNALTAYARLLGGHPWTIRDSIKIMKLEMQPDMTHLWRLEWCFITPPGISGRIAMPGTPAVVCLPKNLFFDPDITLLQMYSNKKGQVNVNLTSDRIAVVMSGSPILFQLTDQADERRNFVLPILFDAKLNTVQVTEFPKAPGETRNSSWAESARQASIVYMKQVQATLSKSGNKLTV